MNNIAQPQSTSWNHYFQSNAKNVLRVKPDGYRLTEVERKRITKSIQQFQLGEASEGNLLRAKAKRFAEQIRDPEYPQMIDSLIKEENRHSAYLAKFMRHQGIATAEKAWTDSIFRILRNLGNLEVSIRLLVTAEVVALVYYRCLGRATQSSVLAEICQRMLDEEEQHVRFQMTQINRINLKRFATFSAAMDIGHALFLHLTTLIVWKNHRSVLRMEYASYVQFFRAVINRFQVAMNEGSEDVHYSFT